MRTESRKWSGVWELSGIAFCLLVGLAPELRAQGFVLSGVGAVNRSLGGAGTAVALDASGPLQWNPAAISALPGTRIDLSVETVFNRNSLRGVREECQRCRCSPVTGSWNRSARWNKSDYLGTRVECDRRVCSEISR